MRIHVCARLQIIAITKLFVKVLCLCTGVSMMHAHTSAASDTAILTVYLQYSTSRVSRAGGASIMSNYNYEKYSILNGWKVSEPRGIGEFL